jgi:citrate synthase
MAEWIGTAEAARRLGIKEASLYSYVSRGILTRRKPAGSRSSLFSAAEGEALAR